MPKKNSISKVRCPRWKSCVKKHGRHCGHSWWHTQDWSCQTGWVCARRGCTPRSRKERTISEAFEDGVRKAGGRCVLSGPDAILAGLVTKNHPINVTRKVHKRGTKK